MKLQPSLFALVFAAAPLAATLVACGSKSTDTPASGTETDSGTPVVMTTTSPPVVTGGSDSGTSVNTPPTTTNDAGGTSGDDDDDASGIDASLDSSTPYVPPSAHHPTTTAPTKNCGYTEDSNGYFGITESSGQYFVHLPSGYDHTKPYPVVIGAHGCGDNAEHFGTWAMDPYNDANNNFQADAQKYIAISVEDSSGGCWDIGHGSKIIAALDDAATCFYVDQARVTIAGYSSGAGAAYATGLANAARFNGILIEDGALYDTGGNEASLLANATWRINIAHMAHNQDPDYTLAAVQADWIKIKAAGFPLTELTEDGDHNGTYQDWAERIIPLDKNWTAPD